MNSTNTLATDRSVLSGLEQSVEKLTGKSVQTIRNLTISEYREEREKAVGRPLRFISRFPFIGRGNVLRDRLVSHEDVERQLDAALR